MTEFRLQVDGVAVRAVPGDTVLSACLKSQLYIPHLCHGEEDGRQAGSCRLCFVAVEGLQRPVCACETNAAPDMVIRTDDPAARRLARGALELLLQDHERSCASCSVREEEGCALLKAARHLGVRAKVAVVGERSQKAADGVGPVAVSPSACVLCGRCVEACRREGRSVLALAGRGSSLALVAVDTHPNARRLCRSCRRCISACPVGALSLRC